MSKKLDRDRRGQNSPASQRLAAHLSAMDTSRGTLSQGEEDVLSLIVSGALQGEDLSQRYPEFYRSLLNNSELRQAFLDALESVEAERGQKLVALPNPHEVNPPFLGEQASKPMLEPLASGGWRSIWERTLEQIQRIFSPPELAYRADPTLFEDSWFTLLRDEIEAGEVTYTVALECSLADLSENALAAFLNCAVTLGSQATQADFPLRATLQWGAYHEDIVLAEEGRARFPNIPLDAILDEGYQNIKAGLSLTLQTMA